MLVSVLQLMDLAASTSSVSIPVTTTVPFWTDVDDVAGNWFDVPRVSVSWVDASKVSTDWKDAPNAPTTKEV